MSIQDEPFLSKPTQFTAAVTESNMITKAATPAFSQANLAAAVIIACNAALSRNHKNKTVTCSEGYSYCWLHGYAP